MQPSAFSEDENPLAGVQPNSTDTRFNYHVEEAAQLSQLAIDTKVKWAMINIDQNVKGMITGMLAKLDEKYQVRS